MALILFDCFDTIVATSPDAPPPGRWAELFAASLDIPLPQAQRAVYPLLAGCLGVGSINVATEEVLARTVCRGPAAPSLSEALAALWVAAGNDDGRFTVMAGAHELLTSLVRDGHTLRLVSNCVLTREQMIRLLGDLDLLAPFERLHLSSEGVGKKPQRDFFLRAAGSGWDRIVMVGDSPEIDLDVPAALGWEVVRIHPGADLRTVLAGRLATGCRPVPTPRRETTCS